MDLDRYRADRDPGPEPEVLVLGAIVPWKRLDLALEAVAIAARELPSLRLTVAGRAIDAQGEELLAALRERATRPDLAGRVTFAGHLDDPREALERSWALLHCADREPFGSVVLQALASGRPVVAPDAGGPAEVVDETRGALYPPGDAQAAAAAAGARPGLGGARAAPGRRRPGLGPALRCRRPPAGSSPRSPWRRWTHGRRTPPLPIRLRAGTWRS